MDLSNLYPGLGGGLPWELISSNTNAAANRGYLINASGGNVTLTLPASPSAGVQVAACDVKNSAETNTITVGRNGSKIEGLDSDLIIDINGSGFRLSYVDAATGWKIVDASNGTDTLSNGFNWPSEQEVTTNQSPTTDDLDQRYLYTPATAADRTVTLPSVGASENGKWIFITNDSKYTITVNAADSDTIGWARLYITGIELLPDCQVALRYDHSQTKWDITFKRGAGKCRPSGTVLYLPMNRCQSGYHDSGNNGYVDLIDLAKDHWVYSTDAETAFVSGGVTHFGLSTAGCDGSSGYFKSSDSADWDVFGSTSNDCTVCGWVRFDTAASSEEEIIAHREDGNNTWFGYRNASGNAKMQVVSGGGTIINLNGGTLSQNTWHHYAVCRVGAEVGLYVDGSQVAYLATFTPDTFAGGLYFAQNGGSTNYFDGRLQDWAICYQNIFNAAPNSTPNDSITIDTLNPLGLVI